MKDDVKASPFQAGKSKKCSTHWVIDKNSGHLLVPGTSQDSLILSSLSLYEMGAVISRCHPWGISSKESFCYLSVVIAPGVGAPSYTNPIPLIWSLLPVLTEGRTGLPSWEPSGSQRSPCWDLHRLWRVASSESRREGSWIAKMQFAPLWRRLCLESSGW